LARAFGGDRASGAQLPNVVGKLEPKRLWIAEYDVRGDLDVAQSSLGEQPGHLAGHCRLGHCVDEGLAESLDELGVWVIEEERLLVQLEGSDPPAGAGYSDHLRHGMFGLDEML
jgi:hypothetical protein